MESKEYCFRELQRITNQLQAGISTSPSVPAYMAGGDVIRAGNMDLRIQLRMDKSAKVGYSAGSSTQYPLFRWIIFTATARLRLGSLALKTDDIPPWPMSSSTWYLPERVFPIHPDVLIRFSPSYLSI
jgi:hypothetical protein